MFLAITIAVAQILGALTSISALLTTRTAQGAIAWIVSLNTFPYLAVPAYWVFGRSRFNGYVRSRKAVDDRIRLRMHDVGTRIERHRARWEDAGGRGHALERVARFPFTRGNSVRLLTDGGAAFTEMFAAIDRARRYCLIQFYIVRNDDLGQRLKTHLIACSRRGVQVYFLYDEIGSYKLSRRYIEELRRGGVRMQPFSSTRGIQNRFQLNFRNHRKALIIDGVEGFLGGLNVGDEYLGHSPRFGPWRDTHIHLVGPALTGLQVPFAEDWHWSTGEFLDLEWRECVETEIEWISGPAAEERDPEALTITMPPVTDTTVLVLPSGPADELTTASLFVQHAIHSASERLWIASPYFVPDEGVQDALKLAVLRGVDVRILIPDRPDHMLVYLSAFAFVGPMIQAGVRIFRYLPGFLHQKVILVDDDVATIGTVNLDNRSFRLNFENTAIVASARFAGQVEEMLERDFHHSREMSAEEIRQMPLWLRLASRVAYLFAPIQ